MVTFWLFFLESFSRIETSKKANIAIGFEAATDTEYTESFHVPLPFSKAPGQWRFPNLDPIKNKTTAGRGGGTACECVCASVCSVQGLNRIDLELLQ